MIFKMKGLKLKLLENKGIKNVFKSIYFKPTPIIPCKISLTSKISHVEIAG